MGVEFASCCDEAAFQSLPSTTTARGSARGVDGDVWGVLSRRDVLPGFLRRSRGRLLRNRSVMELSSCRGSSQRHSAHEMVLAGPNWALGSPVSLANGASLHLRV